MNESLRVGESVGHMLVVSNDPSTIVQLTQSMQQLAISTEVCLDLASSLQALSRKKFEAVAVDFQLEEQARVALERVRTFPSNRTAVTFAITDSPEEATLAFQLGAKFVLE